MRVLIIRPDGAREVRELPGPMSAMLDQLQALVGGYIRPVGREGWGAYVNEDGIELRLPGNPLASALAIALGWRFLDGDALVGTAVFFGRRPGSSTEADVPERAVRLAGVLAMRMEQIARGES